MTAMPRRFETHTDAASVNGRVVRVLGALSCPHCLRQLRATAVRDIGDGEYAWTCTHCHRDTLTITNR
jgi:hypothetical protein